MKQLMYDLKKEYGTPIVLREQSASVFNVETGSQTSNHVDMTIHRAILLPIDVYMSFPNMFKGQGIEEGDFIALIDDKDLPKTCVLQMIDAVIVGAKTFSITGITYMPHVNATQLKLQGVK